MPTEPRMLLERQEEFREAVKKSRGRVVVLVHPYYKTKIRTSEIRFFQKRDRLREYIKIMRRLVQSTKVPIVVFEEDNRIKRSNVMKRNSIFYVGTHSASSDPIDGWERVHNELRKAGANTILLGGMYGGTESFSSFSEAPLTRPIVELYERSLPKPPIRKLVEGCAGHAYVEFIRRKYKKVRWLPNLAFPERPHEKPE